MAKTVDDGCRRWGGTAAIEELAGRTEDNDDDRRDVTDGLGAKVRPWGWLLLLSGTGSPLGNVDVIGDGSDGDGVVTWKGRLMKN